MVDKYATSNDTSSMAFDYLNYLDRYVDTMSKLEALDDGSLNDEELAYYLEVNARITKKLLTIN